jgi:hypothetical protein
LEDQSLPKPFTKLAYDAIFFAPTNWQNLMQHENCTISANNLLHHLTLSLPQQTDAVETDLTFFYQRVKKCHFLETGKNEWKKVV